MAPLNRLMTGVMVLSAGLLGDCLAQEAHPVLVLPERAVPAGDAASGRAAIMQYGCKACHTIRGVPGPYGRVGPNLTGLRSRSYIAGSIPHTPDGLVQWLINPPRFSPRTAMPDMGLSRQEATDIARYLYDRS